MSISAHSSRSAPVAGKQSALAAGRLSALVAGKRSALAAGRLSALAADCTYVVVVDRSGTARLASSRLNGWHRRDLGTSVPSIEILRASCSP